ncbi:YciI family protein [Allokutzneria sp. A3M-2-11 16]|uniref:YciI family protein n=1 Tax=Allokutzneria sp. A3M-2-11 16 TaxID=2962043 RepID=UPI0020B7CB54|nr:YciI family protein [Allokutzneria sp. A3M-2-11 16]MCP3798644.1 YciI family protein [Allokutzneria sp. A3M-2-11 16]
MYIAMLSYTAPIDEIDYLLAEHIEWANKQYESGCFLASGRRPGDEGRVIIARPMARGRLDALLAGDPLVLRRMARYQVIEFSCTRTDKGMLAYNEALGAAS